MTTTLPTETELEELGFATASKKLKADRELARKMRIAFEHFRIVEPKHINEFNTKLLKSTQVKTDRYGSYNYKALAFIPIEKYAQIPPTEVLDKVREAKVLGCFDNFEVAVIEDRHQSRVPDPIIFGIINGCSNKYYVAQWDDDVKIEDILKEDEG